MKKFIQNHRRDIRDLAWYAGGVIVTTVAFNYLVIKPRQKYTNDLQNRIIQMHKIADSAGLLDQLIAEQQRLDQIL